MNLHLLCGWPQVTPPMVDVADFFAKRDFREAVLEAVLNCQECSPEAEHRELITSQSRWAPTLADQR